tara:strand:- start:78264 stop:79517 length:1254 start_codon:yes stop_codon:yes gene_type:complete
VSKPESIKVFEYQSIAWKGRYSDKRFTSGMFSAFEKYFQANERTPFFEMIPYGVRFKQYVGAIQIGKHTIEVLPKVGKEDRKDIWQKVLLDMLKTCHMLTAKQTGNATLKLRANSVLELYFELFVSKVEALIHQGLIKKYRKTEGQQKALKGALVFSKNIAKNVVHKERFYTRHSVYDKNHLLHQVLFVALGLVKRLSTESRLKDRIGRVELDFPDVNALQVTEAHFSKLSTDRKTFPYKNAVSIAKLLILNYRPDLSAGRNDVLALMFDMNVLWEEYVYHILKKNVSIEFEVLAQRRHKFWETKIVKPDIVLKNKETNQVFVIDTKWKVIDNKKPADNDLKQMYVYNHHWNSSHSVLLYPRTNNQKDIKGTFAKPFNDASHHCTLGFVDVIDNSGLRRDIYQNILDMIRVKDQLLN